MEVFHSTSMRSFLHADKSTSNALRFLDFACNNIATTVVSRFNFGFRGFGKRWIFNY